MDAYLMKTETMNFKWLGFSPESWERQFSSFPQANSTPASRNKKVYLRLLIFFHQLRKINGYSRIIKEKPIVRPNITPVPTEPVEIFWLIK